MESSRPSQIYGFPASSHRVSAASGVVAVVLLPDLDAGCSLADSITADELRAWKAQHPGAVVVM